MVYGQLGIAALWGFFIASSLLLFPVWLVRRLRGKITPGAAIRIRLWPLLALHGGHGVARNPGTLFLKFWRHRFDDLGLTSRNQDFSAKQQYWYFAASDHGRCCGTNNEVAYV